MSVNSAPATHLEGNIALVDRYLQLCEDRETDAASRLLAPSIRIEFPGNLEYHSLEELFAAATGNYTWVRKRRIRYLEGESGTQSFVISLGTLYGEQMDGTPFEGVRYIDTFLISDELITEQVVSNDLAIVGISPIISDAPPASE